MYRREVATSDAANTGLVSEEELITCTQDTLVGDDVGHGKVPTSEYRNLYLDTPCSINGS